MPTALLPAIPSQVSRQCLQGHSALLAELPLAEPAPYTLDRQPVSFFTAPPPSRLLLLFVHIPTASNARATWKDVVGLTDTFQLSSAQSIVNAIVGP